jgi:hypothetical protein
VKFMLLRAERQKSGSSNLVRIASSQRLLWPHAVRDDASAAAPCRPARCGTGAPPLRRWGAVRPCERPRPGDLPTEDRHSLRGLAPV